MSSTWDSKALKATPIAADEILLIDTANGRNQKRATISSLGVGIWSRNGGSGFIFPTTLTDSIRMGTNPGQTGVINIPNNQSIAFRNTFNNADATIKYTTSNFLEYDVSNQHDFKILGTLKFAVSSEGATVLGELDTTTIDNTGTVRIGGNLTVDPLPTPTFFVDATSNRVGIGVGSPEQDLHIVGDDGGGAQVGVRILNNSTTGFTGLNLFNNVGKLFTVEVGGSAVTGTIAGITNVNIAKLVSDADNFVIGTNANTPVQFITNSLERMRIDSSGVVSIQNTLDMTSGLINNVLDPVSAQDAATKNYIDSNFTTTSDVLTSQTVIIGNGTKDVKAAEGTSGRIHVSANNEELLIDALVASQGTLALRFRDSTGGPHLEISHSEITENSNIFSTAPLGIESIGILSLLATTDLTLTTNTANILFQTSVATERMRITNSGDVGIGTTSPSAALEVASTTNGFLPPSMTPTQRDAISSPTSGLMIYDITNNDHNYYNGTEWRGFLTSIAGSFAPGGVAFGSGSSDHSLEDDPTEFFWDNTNNRLGIGTNTPAQKLDVVGSVGTNGVVRIQATNTNSGGFTDQFLFNNIGRFIGLQLGGSAVTGTTAGITNVNIAKLISSGDNFVLGNASNAPIEFITNNIERMRILSGGNVGIGTATPTALLDVSSNVGGNNAIRARVGNSNPLGFADVFLVNNSARFIQLQIGGGNLAGDVIPGVPRAHITNLIGNGDNFVIGNTGATPLIFSTNTLERMRIDGSGIVSIQNTLDMTSGLINNVLDPVSAQDAATKNYVDTGFAAITPTPLNNQVAVWSSSSALDGSTGLTFAGESTNILTVGSITGLNNGVLQIHSAFTPVFEMLQQGGGVDKRIWRTTIDGGIQGRDIINDALSTVFVYEKITRDVSPLRITEIEYTTDQFNIVGNLAVDTDTLIVDATNDRVVIGNVANGLTDLTIFQNAANVNKGITLSGTSATGNSSTTEGVTLQIGFNTAGNTQLWVTNKADLGNAAKNSFRYIVGADVPLIVGVNNNGTLNKSLAFGLNAAGAHCGFGFPTSVTQAQIQAQIHIQTGVSSVIGLIVQSAASQTVDVFQVRDSGGTVQIVMDENFRLGIGATNPATLLDINAVSDPDTTALITLTTSGANAGAVQTFVGNRNPNGVVTGTPGSNYIRDDGLTSKRYLNREASAGTTWDEYSTNPPSIIELKTSDDFNDLASGGIVTISVNTTFVVKSTIVTSNRIVINSGISCHIVGQSTASGVFVYTGNDTFVTSTGAFRVLSNVTLVSAGSTATLITQTGTGVFRVSECAIVGWNSLGSMDGGILSLQTMSFSSVDGGLTMTNIFAATVIGIAQVGTPLTGALFTINTNDPAGRFGFNSSLISSLSTDSAVFDISTKTSNKAAFGITGIAVDTGDLFKQTTITNATINSVVDASPATGTITAFADDVTGISTTVSSTTTYFEDEEITISGTTSYNGAFQIFEVVTGVSFKIRTPFVADDATGSIASVRIDMTLAAGHGVTIGMSIKVIDSQFYNLFYTVLDLTGDVITLNQTFVLTDTGSIERNVGLDETDVRIDARDSESADSTVIAFGSVNDNTTNTVVTDGTYAAVDISVLVSDAITERFKLIDSTLGIWEYIGNEAFKGFLTGGLWAVKTGSTVNYRFAMSINGVVPTFATALYSPMEVKTTKVSIPMEFVVNLTKGETIQIMVAGDGTADNLMITDIRMGIK